MKPPDEAARPATKQNAPKGNLHRSESAQRIRKSIPLNTAVGSFALCAWQPVPGITWIQCRFPLFARKLAQRRDSHLVMEGVAGGYLRTFEFRHNLAWARSLIERYIRNLTATNEAEADPILTCSALSLDAGVQSRRTI